MCLYINIYRDICSAKHKYSIYCISAVRAFRKPMKEKRCEAVGLGFSFLSVSKKPRERCSLKRVLDLKGDQEWI